MAASAARAASRCSGLGGIRTKSTMGVVTRGSLPKAGGGWGGTERIRGGRGGGGWARGVGGGRGRSAGERGRAFFEEGAPGFLAVLAAERPLDVGDLEAQLLLHVDRLCGGHHAALQQPQGDRGPGA